MEATGARGSRPGRSSLL